MKKSNIFAIVASVGFLTGQAMAFTVPVLQNTNIGSNNNIVQASVNCKVNWVNGACGTPDFVRGNNGGGQAPTYPTPMGRPMECYGYVVGCYNSCCE